MSNARPTFTQDDLLPREMGAFTHRQNRYAKSRQRDLRRWGAEAEARSMVILPGEFDVRALVSQSAVATIRKAFTQARTSHESWRTAKREGKIDFRRAPAASRGAVDIFKRRDGRSVTRVKCAVLVDDSGSMNGHGATISVEGTPVGVTKKQAAAVFGATIAQALGAVPTIDLDVFYHSAASHHMSLKWRWHKGTPVAVFNGASVNSTSHGGNADGHAIHAITERIQREIRRGEHGVLMVVSDGLPSVYANGGAGDAGSALIDAVREARAAGIIVIGVAIDGADQSAYYGDGYVPFTGDWTALGKTLGSLVGKTLASHR